MHLELGPRVIIQFSNGVYITESVCWAVIVAVAMIVVAHIATRNMQRNPKGLQAVAELIVETTYKFVKNTMGSHNVGFAPFIGTLFLFLLFCNALGLLGQRAASADMNFAFALSIMVFFVIQGSSIRSQGIKGYLKHFAEPVPFMVPIKIIEECVFPVSLGFRLFGNILAGFIIIHIFMYMMGGLSANIGLPIPLLQAVTPLPAMAFFDVFEPVLQAFVFSMLTMVFVAKGIIVHGHGNSNGNAKEAS
ncbi:MAG: F0F1 ATP synthase subunit A [Clostridiales bacterium]|nr:F0F1 ATP synthase subunit A [Clostridiales bacterium]